jgi:hypothetical protein
MGLLRYDIMRLDNAEKANGKMNLPSALDCGIFSKALQRFLRTFARLPSKIYYQGVPRCQSYDTILSASAG